MAEYRVIFVVAIKSPQRSCCTCCVPCALSCFNCIVVVVLQSLSAFRTQRTPNACCTSQRATTHTAYEPGASVVDGSCSLLLTGSVWSVRCPQANIRLMNVTYLFASNSCFFLFVLFQIVSLSGWYATNPHPRRVSTGACKPAASAYVGNRPPPSQF